MQNAAAAYHLIPLRFRFKIREGCQYIIRALSVNSRSRTLLNKLYQKLSFAQMRFCHAFFAKIFRETEQDADAGTWAVRFAGKQIVTPLKPNRMWLDWDTALSVLGHDVEVKQTYASLIESDMRPDVFIDVGANYGVHSLLFLVHGIETLSFEPNEVCHDYFRELCALNRVEPRIVDAALADRRGWTDLWFPEKQTWLGTTNGAVREQLETETNLVRRQVKQDSLDEYLGDIEGRRLLLKIDAEGSECLVLKGAVRLMEKCRPLIILECHRGDNRNDLFNILNGARYNLLSLPWPRNRSISPLGLEDFLSSPAVNFIAVHQLEASVKSPAAASGDRFG